MPGFVCNFVQFRSTWCQVSRLAGGSLRNFEQNKWSDAADFAWRCGVHTPQRSLRSSMCSCAHSFIYFCFCFQVHYLEVMELCKNTLHCRIWPVVLTLDFNNIERVCKHISPHVSWLSILPSSFSAFGAPFQASGLVAGVLVTFLTHPLWLAKARMEMQAKEAEVCM